MVQKGCCPDVPFTAATEACRRRRKRGGKGKTVTCFSPWSVISCWFHLGRWKGGMNLDHELGGDEDAENRIALGCLDPAGSSNSALEVSGDRNKEASFSLGVGLGLIYLMATNKNEMSKLEELCKQMEAMLQNFKREFPNDQQRNDANIINTSYSTPKAQVFSNYPIDDHVSVQNYPSYSWEQENSEFGFTSSSCQNSHSKVNRKGKRLLETDQLEAELEAELEYLQLQLDDEVLLSYSDQKNSEIGVEEEPATEETMSTSFSEAIKKLDIENTKHQGVHPRELEKRLHELQEERQQERIKELELELSWWKDTARIVFQHSPQKTTNLED